MPHETAQTDIDRQTPEFIKASWRRSSSAGLLEESSSSAALSELEVSKLRSRSKVLLKYAKPSMENTYEQLAGSACVVLVADADGVVLSSKGDADFLNGPDGSRFLAGSYLGEGVAGTNAIGTCIADRVPLAVKTDEHFLRRFRSISGVAAPIFDSTGLLLGVIAAYSERPGFQSLTLGFIRTVAVLIENRTLVREMASELVLHFHPQAEYIGTIKQGIVVFNANGKLIGSNTAARSMLGLGLNDVPTKRFNDLFSDALSQSGVVEKMRSAEDEQFLTRLKDGREVALAGSVGATCEPSLQCHEIKQEQPARTTLPSEAQVLLSDLDLGDAQMRRAISKASMIQGSDIPLLIEGESGVGKEVFTTAFHNSGPRRSGPLVAVNCAAIPEGLIESELFGYEEGAFTGAKKKGYEGRIMQANGGTLFLDEIGDMPLTLQGRLLRVLQQRQIAPLGSNKTIAVDISLVCATHRNLRAEIAAGRFREDLYYRLNGLRICLPPLRQRTDLDRLIDLVVGSVSGGRAIEIEPEVRASLRSAPWPGNIRELQMVLRTAIAILGRGTKLTLDHLPDDFLPLTASVDEPHSSPDQEWNDLAHIEADAIRKAMVSSERNVSKAARVLGISRKTLYRKLAQLQASDASDSAGHAKS